MGGKKKQVKKQKQLSREEEIVFLKRVYCDVPILPLTVVKIESN